jgi:hypothetical protein
MTTNQVLAEVLDETVKALSNLDSDKLQALEQRIVTLAGSSDRYEGDDAGLVLSKRRLLEIILQNCKVSLDALTRLHARNMRNQWAQ